MPGLLIQYWYGLSLLRRIIGEIKKNTVSRWFLRYFIDTVKAQTEMDTDWGDIAVNTAYLAGDLQIIINIRG